MLQPVPLLPDLPIMFYLTTTLTLKFFPPKAPLKSHLFCRALSLWLLHFILPSFLLPIRKQKHFLPNHCVLHFFHSFSLTMLSTPVASAGIIYVFDPPNHPLGPSSQNSSHLDFQTTLHIFCEILLQPLITPKYKTKSAFLAQFTAPL